ncbi:MAG: RNA 3'-terminal phosphate cyclase [Aquificota bacterium]|nr:RNA 3'-terminal phosphate cyclase [Aquificota bacterium]MDQ7082888.1 RNA 3'-terminal phosphate cyclase [Aquificota bacterium]
MIEIDGSYGEGGGQILRTALALSCILGVPVRIKKVRVSRERPGLRRQHLWVVKTLKDICSAKVEGARIGSQEVTFVPGDLRDGVYEVNLGSAGSIPLFLQAVLPVVLLTPGEVDITVVGGTEVPGGPTVDWFRFVYVPYLRSVPDLLRVEVHQRGYTPEGGGRVRLLVRSGLKERLRDPKEIGRFLKERGVSFKGDRGSVKRVHLISVAHEFLRERKVVERQVKGALDLWSTTGLPHPETYRQYVRTISVGTSVTMWIEDELGNVMGADSLGKKGKPAEVVGEECARKLYEDWSSGANVDRHLADHLVLWIAFTGGSIRVPQLTGHLITNVWVCERFLGEGVFRVLGKEKVIEAVV